MIYPTVADLQVSAVLPHIWVFLDADQQVIRVDASWHGGFNTMQVDGRPPLEGGCPAVWSEPGKHAFAPSSRALPAWVSSFGTKSGRRRSPRCAGWGWTPSAATGRSCYGRLAKRFKSVLRFGVAHCARVAYNWIVLHSKDLTVRRN
jgi:hypothetical protein